MLKKLLILAVLAVPVQSLSYTQSPQPLAAPEQAMSAFVDASRQASNDLLARLVSINSGTHNLEGVRAVAGIMKSELNELGFKVDFIPMDQIPARAFNELDEEQPIVVMCHHGARSLSVANWLRQKGFEKAQSVKGGIDLWSSVIDPTIPRY